MPAALSRVIAPAALVSIALALLAGCTPEQAGGGPSDAPSAGSTPSTEPSAQPTDQPNSTPVGASCAELVPADTIYVYNPNFAPIARFTPEDGTPAASALAYQGVACRWENGTNGFDIDVSVAQLDEETLTALKNAAFEDREMVPTYGEEAYFSVESELGVAEVFQGPFWIVAQSPVFLEPGDATEIVDSVLAALS
jgi:hypothetical protein